MNIYQEIWDADQQESGIKPILPHMPKPQSGGYVVVNEKAGNEDKTHRLFPEVLIPDEKMKSYELCQKLFDNYNLAPSQREISSPEEDAEIHQLLEHIVDSKAMKVARNYLAQKTGEVYNYGRWYKILMDIWFTQFSQSSGEDLSAFEHIIVGEQDKSGGKVGGYHFWYKYYLDDTNNLFSDSISYLGTAGTNQEQNIIVPEVSTISYKWDAFDYQSGSVRPLFKPTGGFFNGCSIAGLIAIGTVRFLPDAAAPWQESINGGLYNFVLHRSLNKKHLRTFYPEFIKKVIVDEPSPVEPVPPIVDADTKSVKIIYAFVNPEGEDVGKENITLLNISPQEISLDGWLMEDKQGKKVRISDKKLKTGEILTIFLSGTDVQLSNKGGIIILKDKTGKTIDTVSYSSDQAQKQGWIIVF